MKAIIHDRSSAETDVVVDESRTIAFMGERARVYATPFLIRDIEIACRLLLLEHLDAGEDSVGTRVEVDHLAPTLAGMTVTIQVRIAAVDGQSIRFEVAAHNGHTEILRGHHHRHVVIVTEVEERLKAFAQRVGSRML